MGALHEGSEAYLVSSRTQTWQLFVLSGKPSWHRTCAWFNIYVEMTSRQINPKVAFSVPLHSECSISLMQPLLIHWICCRVFITLQERKCWKQDYHKHNPEKPLNWTDKYHKRQKQH